METDETELKKLYVRPESGSILFHRPLRRGTRCDGAGRLAVRRNEDSTGEYEAAIPSNRYELVPLGIF